MGPILDIFEKYTGVFLTNLALLALLFGLLGPAWQAPGDVSVFGWCAANSFQACFDMAASSRELGQLRCEVAGHSFKISGFSGFFGFHEVFNSTLLEIFGFFGFEETQDGILGPVMI